MSPSENTQKNVPTKELPHRPNLEFHKNQAKALLKKLKTNNPSSQELVTQLHPRIEEVRKRKYVLQDALLVHAREYGFASWPRFKNHVHLLTDGPASQKHRPFQKNIQYYKERAEGLYSVYRTNQKRSFELIRRFHPNYQKATDDEIQAADISVEDCQWVFAREHGFQDWEALSQHIRALEQGEVKEPFLDAFEAIKADDFAEFKKIINENPDLPNTRGTNGNSLLNLSVSFKRSDMVSHLIESGADVDLPNNKGWTPLHQAVYGNLPEMTQKLLEEGASIELMAHGEGGTPLAVALFWGHRQLADQLSEYGIYPNNLRIAAGLGRLDLMKTFFNDDGSLTEAAFLHREFHRPHSGFPAWTPRHDQQEVLDEALVFAAKCGRTKAFPFLIEHGANINGEPYNGTPLHWAARGEKQEAIAWLLDHGADIHQKANFGGESELPPLHVAAWAGKTENALYLVERGGDLGFRDHKYYGNARGWANHNGHPETSKALVQLMPQERLIFAVQENNFADVRKILEEEPSIIHHQDDGGETALFPAAWLGYIDIAEYLLKHGIDINAKRVDQKTALDNAYHMKQEAMIAFLREHGGKTRNEFSKSMKSDL